MRVLLIAPTALDMRERPVTQRRLHLPALTLPLLAALTPAPADIRLVYETVSPIPFDEPWDLVGITGIGSGIVRAWRIADEFRRRGRRVVIGGIAATLGRPEWTLRHADALVLGEAGELWPQVVNDARAGRLRQVYRMETPPDLGALPVPRYDLMDRRTIGFWRPVQAARGCPYSCSYCSTSAFHQQRYRKRPVEQVVRDVRADPARRVAAHRADRRQHRRGLRLQRATLGGADTGEDHLDESVQPADRRPGRHVGPVGAAAVACSPSASSRATRRVCGAWESTGIARNATVTPSGASAATASTCPPR